MIRKINLTHYKNKSQSIDGFVEIPITDLNNIINFSVDILYCSVVNMIEKNKILDFLNDIIKKIRYGGQLTLVINDIKNICQLFINKQISDDQFFDIIDNNKNNISEEQVIKYVLDTNWFDIIGIEKNRSMTAISFARKNND